jgi:hypothetical protein
MATASETITELKNKVKAIIQKLKEKKPADKKTEVVKPTDPTPAAPTTNGTTETAAPTEPAPAEPAAAPTAEATKVEEPAAAEPAPEAPVEAKTEAAVA